MENFDDKLIIKYLEGDLTSEEKDNFERVINNNPPLNKEVTKYKELIEGLHILGVNQDKVMVNELEKNYFESKVNDRFKFNGKWLMMAASLSILLLAVLTFKFFSNTSERIYENNFSAYPALSYNDRGDEADESTVMKAFEAYNNKDYSKAILFFEEIMTTREDPMLKFYLANAYLSNRQFSDAIITLESYLKNKDAVLTTQAKWYLSLAYIGNDNETLALPILEEIVRNEGSYAEKAKGVLHKLK